jgi:molybdate transport system substrate-binding protein
MPAIMGSRPALARAIPCAIVWVLVASSFGAGDQPESPVVTILASNGVRAAVEHVRPELDRRSVGTVRVSFGTSAAIRGRIVAGEAFDVAMLTADALDALIETGSVVAGSRADLGRSGMGLAVRQGARRPDISTARALGQTLAAARSLTYAADGATRDQIERMLATLQLLDVVRAKTVLEQGSNNATGRVARGESELVITLVSEIVPVDGIELVGLLPAEFQRYLSFAAGVSANAKRPDDAQALVAFLSGPAAAEAFTARGIER